MYRLIDREKAPPSRGWGTQPDFTTYRCSHCGAWLVLRGETVPKTCGKCHL